MPEISELDQRIIKVAIAISALPGSRSANLLNVVPQAVCDKYGSKSTNTARSQEQAGADPAWFEYWNEAGRYVAAFDAPRDIHANETR